MKRSFVFSPDSEADALSIWEYEADRASESAADRLIARIYDECQKVGETPGLGHFRDDLLDRRYKFWWAHLFLIAYEWEAKPIRVIAVVHGARNLSASLRRRTP